VQALSKKEEIKEKIQEKDAKFPYIPIAAIVIRNTEIQGFRNDESKIQFLN
jgi:hypothetical protein